jgi:hypothetical protein
MADTHYTEGFTQIVVGGSTTSYVYCQHCEQRWFLHGEQSRCYTAGELDAALRFHEHHHRWPEGLFRPEEAHHA